MKIQESWNAEILGSKKPSAAVIDPPTAVATKSLPLPTTARPGGLGASFVTGVCWAHPVKGNGRVCDSFGGREHCVSFHRSSGIHRERSRLSSSVATSSNTGEAIAGTLGIVHFLD
jgi:hypothetical protein